MNGHTIQGVLVNRDSPISYRLANLPISESAKCTPVGRVGLFKDISLRTAPSASTTSQSFTEAEEPKGSKVMRHCVLFNGYNYFENYSSTVGCTVDSR